MVLIDLSGQTPDASSTQDPVRQRQNATSSDGTDQGARRAATAPNIHQAHFPSSPSHGRTLIVPSVPLSGLPNV